MGALRAFGLASLTTDSVYVEPRWDYLPARGITTRKHTARPTVGQVGAALQEWADEYADLPAMTPAATLAASVDPMGAHRASLAIEHAATRFLAAHGEHLPRPDVWSRRHHAHVTRPDVVAFKGLPRYELPQPCRYGRTGAHAAVETRRAVRLVGLSDTPEWQTVDVAEYLTTLPGEGLTRQAWRGHRRITLTLRGKTRGAAEQATRAAAKAARAMVTGAGARGPAVDPFDRSAATLAAACKARNLSHVVTTLESIVRTSTDGATLTFGPVTVTVMGAAQVITAQGRAYPVREWARRAALAGIDPMA
jgi:hypothetical protein